MNGRTENDLPMVPPFDPYAISTTRIDEMLNWFGSLMLRSFSAPVVAISLSSSPAIAQANGDAVAQSDEIFVIGRDERESQALDAQIRDFIGGMTPEKGINPLARLDPEKLCPRAFGASATFNQAVGDRMRRVATAIGVNVADKDCRSPNALVLFVNDKAATIATMRNRYPWLFSTFNGERIRVGKEKGPVSAWHVDGRLTRDGRPIGLDGGSPSSTLSASRLQPAARPVFLMSVVVIESRGAAGLTAVQIADYAAMRTFSNADPGRFGKIGTPTILKVLDAPMGSETPRSMTAWDLNFLRGLYASEPNAFAPTQRGAIRRYVKHELTKVDDGR